MQASGWKRPPGAAAEAIAISNSDNPKDYSCLTELKYVKTYKTYTYGKITYKDYFLRPKALLSENTPLFRGNCTGYRISRAIGKNPQNYRICLKSAVVTINALSRYNARRNDNICPRIPIDSNLKKEVHVVPDHMPYASLQMPHT